MWEPKWLGDGLGSFNQDVIGTCKLDLLEKEVYCYIIHVSDIRSNLISLSSLHAFDYKLVFYLDIVDINYENSRVCCTILSKDFFTLDVFNIPYCLDIECFNMYKNVIVFTWHSQLDIG